jgi:predicted AlkP superfamily pyrophosphatase or phosphodiesterase
MRLLPLLVLLTACPTTAVEPEPTPTPIPPVLRTLVIGLDGVRGDALEAAATPEIDALRSSGAWTFAGTTQLGAPTVSGPGWTSIVTGVDADKHGIYGNSNYDARDTTWPSFLWRAQNAGLATCGAIHWIPIQTSILEDDVLDEHAVGTDQDVTDGMVAMIGGGVCDVAFVHLDDVDGAGHSTGFALDNPAYIEQIEIKDAQVGQLAAAVAAREGEDWLIAITSDHGGRGTGHGGVSDEERTIPLVFSGPSASVGELSGIPSHLDVHPTVLQHVGVEPTEAWNIDGVVVDLQ